MKVIETERLILRNITEDDVHEMFVLRSSPEMMKYIARPLHKNEEETLVFIKNGADILSFPSLFWLIIHHLWMRSSKQLYKKQIKNLKHEIFELRTKKSDTMTHAPLDTDAD